MRGKGKRVVNMFEKRKRRKEPSPATYCTLMLGDFPLFQLQGDEYFCPTCEKIIRSSYGLEQTEEFREERMNGENVLI